MSDEPSPMQEVMTTLKAAFDAACKEHGVQPAEAGLQLIYQHAQALSKYGVEHFVLMNLMLSAIITAHEGDTREFSKPPPSIH